MIRFNGPNSMIIMGSEETIKMFQEAIARDAASAGIKLDDWKFSRAAGRPNEYPTHQDLLRRMFKHPLRPDYKKDGQTI